MRRLGRGAWPALGVVLAMAGPAGAASPIVIGPGLDPGVAIDSAGTAHVVYNDNAVSDQVLHYCRLPRGAAACGPSQNLTLPGSTTTRPYVFVDGQTVRILAYRYGMSGGPFAQDFLLTSTDGGQTFSPPVAVGTLEADDAVAGPGAAISIVSAARSTSPSYQRVPTDGSAAATTAAQFNSGYPYETTVGLDGERPLAASTSLSSNPEVAVDIFRGGDPNVAGNWGSFTLGNGTAPHLAGGPVGLFLAVSVPSRSSGDSTLTVFALGEDDRFPQYGIPVSYSQPGPIQNSALVQDGAGVLQALYASGDNAGHLFQTASGDQANFTDPVEIVSDSGFTGLRAAAGFDHAGLAVWNTGNGSSAVVHATPFVSTLKANIPAPYDLRAKGIEVTQSVQTQEAGFLGGELPSLYPLPPEGQLPQRLHGNVRYRGLDLAAGSKTVVRFFGDAAAAGAGSAPKARRVLGVLHGFRNGKELPGSPLLAENGSLTLTDGGCPCVTTAERKDSTASFDFTLPLDWTSAGPQRLTLRGELRQQADILTSFANARFNRTSATRRECATCAANNSLTMTDIRFVQTPTVLIAPVRMLTAGQADLPDPAAVFAAALNLHPGGERFVVAPYQGTLDVSIEAKLTETSPECKSYVDRGEMKDCRNDAYFFRVGDWDNLRGGISDMAIGVNAQERGAAANSLFNLPVGNPDKTATPDEKSARPIATVNVNRPLTSVAHELGHLLGRGHASAACGGGGEDWPPDQKGVMDGIGLDRSRLIAGPGSPYRVVGSAYDVMSYCASEKDAWIAQRTWRAEIGTLNRFGNRVGFGVRDFPAAVLKVGAKVGRAAGARRLHVSAIADAAGVRITGVAPAVRPVPPPAASDFQLVVTSRDGAAVSTTPMAVTPSHSEGGGRFAQLEADVPFDATAGSVAIVSGGATLATRARSAHPPTVKVTAPTSGARIGRSGVVRWAASDSDGDALMASVAYSLDDGRHWRTIFSGPDAGSAVLPGAYFSASKHGRVAVRVNDGFDEAAAVSQRFRALGAAPVVRLLSPAAGARILNTSTLVLSGQAIDDAGKILTGRRLQWFAGARRLGRGASLSTADLAPGKQRIRLVAMDRTGRRGSATVLVTVAATVPQLLSLDGPKKVARKARSVTLKLAVSARSNLAVNGRRFTVGQRPKAVRIPIRRGAGVLKLRLVLRAGGKSTVLKIRLPRG